MRKTGVTASNWTSTTTAAATATGAAVLQNDAQRAMVSVGIDGVDVRHLDEGEQRKQRQTHHHDRDGGTRPHAAIARIHG